VVTFGEAQEVSLTTEMISMPTYTMGPDEKQSIFRGFTVPGIKPGDIGNRAGWLSRGLRISFSAIRAS